MNPQDLTYPVPIIPHEVWSVSDSSKLTLFMDCPRRFFFRHVLGWEYDYPNIHLDFGSTWHIAMEYLLEHLRTDGYSAEVLLEAYRLLEEKYRESFDESMDQDNGAKTPANALIALTEYAKKYVLDRDKYNVLYTEVVGTVPLSEHHLIHFKIDAILEGLMGILCREHKTSGQDSEVYQKSHQLSIQTGTYTHALYCAFPSKHIYGVEINLAILRKKGNEFRRIPVIRSEEGMASWLYTTIYWMNMVDYHFRLLSESSADDYVLRAFPQNPQACTKFNTLCPYHAFCSAWANPLKNAESPPIGFKVDFWDPRSIDLKAKFKMSESGEIKEIKHES